MLKMDIKQLKEQLPTLDASLTSGINEEFKIMANTAPVLLWMVDKDKNCFFVNKSWLQFTGRKQEQEYGFGWAESIHPEDIDNFLKLYVNKFDRKEEFKIEYRLRRHDGQYRWILDHGVPHFSNDHVFLGYVGSSVDIQDLKDLEKSKNQFITAASHELNTPITSLSVYLHLILEFLKDKQEEKIASYAESAVDQVNKITCLINQLLDLSHIQGDSLEMNWSVFSFSELIKSIVTKIQPVNQIHQIEIKGSSRSMIKADWERLSQAIENSILNAFKYAGGNEKIIVEISEDTKYVYASVIDFGIGIDSDHLPKIFDRFYRVPGIREETFPGLGIGLFISKQIISKHSGNISVESIRNKQTKFNFQIPIFIDTVPE
jgi:PAS domain S-box-containing protein